MVKIKTASKAEKFVAEFISKQNYWVGTFEKGVSGSQPFDLIAIGKNVLALDVKLMERDYFPFTRIEENQHNALSYLSSLKVNYSLYEGFAIVYKDEIYFLSYNDYLAFEKEGMKAVKTKDLCMLGEIL